jgi:hypothetical protein
MVMVMAYQVVSWVLSHAPSDLRPSEMLVALVLAEHAAEDGTHAYPSVPVLAAKARLGERAAQLALKELLRRQVIAVECPATNKLPTMYCFPLYRGAHPAPQELSTRPHFSPNGGAHPAPQENLGVQNTAVGVHFTTLGVQTTASRGAESAHKPSVEPSVKPPEEPPGSGASAPATSPKPPRVQKKPGTPVAEDFDPGPGGYEWAYRELDMYDVEIGQETAAFVDYWRGRGELMVDWQATWRNWMRKSRQFKGKRR